jgi:hypothetical protein
MLGREAPVKAEVTVNEQLGTQPDADGYLACHDVGVNASEPSGRTKEDRSRSASRLPKRSPVTQRPDHIPDSTIARRRGVSHRRYVRQRPISDLRKPTAYRDTFAREHVSQWNFV